MLTVSYYDTKDGSIRNKAFSGWSQALTFASRKALVAKACPVIIASDEGHVLYQVNK